MFGTATNEALPSEYLTDYAAWDGYMARVWRPLLARLGVPEVQRIVEVAPGNSVKLGLALAALDFRGELFLIEPGSVGPRIAERYRALLPHASVTLVTKKLGEALADVPIQVDLLIANHPLDDMLIAACATPEMLTRLFDSEQMATEEIAEPFRECWAAMNGQAAQLDAMMERVAEEWLRAIGQIRPHGILMAQYASSALQKGQMDDLNRYAKSILLRLQSATLEGYVSDAGLQPLLNQNKHYSNVYIGTEVLDAQHWWAARLVG